MGKLEKWDSRYVDSRYVDSVHVDSRYVDSTIPLFHFSTFPDLLVELSEPQKCKSVKVEKYTFTSVKMHIFGNDTKTQFLSKNVKNPKEKHPPQQCILYII